MFTGSHLRAVTDADDNAGYHSTTTRASYRQWLTTFCWCSSEARHHSRSHFFLLHTQCSHSRREVCPSPGWDRPCHRSRGVGPVSVAIAPGSASVAIGTQNYQNADHLHHRYKAIIESRPCPGPGATFRQTQPNTITVQHTTGTAQCDNSWVFSLDLCFSDLVWVFGFFFYGNLGIFPFNSFQIFKIGNELNHDDGD